MLEAKRKETIKKLIENGLYQKWLDGAKVQMTINFGETWFDIDYPDFHGHFSHYRIKPGPEVKYRPFLPEESLNLPGMTIINNKDNQKYEIHSVIIYSDKSVAVRIYNDRLINANRLLSDYKFINGSPCGILDV
jgi:hypothetical protein